MKELSATAYKERFGNKTNSVSVELCKSVVRLKLTKEFQLYMYLKLRCSGCLVLNTETLNDIAFCMKRSPRTVKNNIKKLLQLNWIGKDGSTFYIRAQKEIKKQLGICSKAKGILLNLDLNKVHEWAFSAVVTYNDKRLQFRKSRKKVQPKTSTYQFDKGFAVSLMSKVLSIPKSTASRWKQRSIKAGLMSFEQRFEPLYIPWHIVRFEMLHNPAFCARVKIEGNKIKKRISDEIVLHSFVFAKYGTH